MITKIIISQVTGSKVNIIIDVASDESNEANLDLNNYNLTTGLYFITVHSKDKVNNLRFTFNK